ncbi:uncharacterized protein, partial [Eucyclogobius newberryi]|uniref:uncharacterized protein n=1 Tax=Eucyclogobius newberryi TaxID=166745 RepID=UPI003B5A7EC1
SLADLYANPELLLQRKYSSSSSSSSSRQVTAFRSAPNSPSTLPRHQATSRGQQRDAEDRCTSRGQQRDAEDRCTSRGQQRDAEDRCTSRGQQRDAEDRCTSRGQQRDAEDRCTSRGQQRDAEDRCTSRGQQRDAEDRCTSRGQQRDAEDRCTSRGQQRDAEERSSDMFLDRLRQVNSPQRSALDELREVKRASRPPPCGFQTTADSSENMIEDERFNVGFTRDSRGRSSLPLGHSTPIRERALGVVYLQLGEETKQVQVSSALSNMAALCALFVRAFPQQLSLRLLQAPHASICIRDSSHSSYRPLEDVRSISAQCCLKVYFRDPGSEFRGRPSSSSSSIISGGAEPR